MTIISYRTTRNIVKFMTPGFWIEAQGWGKVGHIEKMLKIRKNILLYFLTSWKQTVCMIMISNRPATNILKFISPGFWVETPERDISDHTENMFEASERFNSSWYSGDHYGPLASCVSCFFVNVSILKILLVFKSYLFHLLYNFSNFEEFALKYMYHNFLTFEFITYIYIWDAQLYKKMILMTQQYIKTAI